MTPLARRALWGKTGPVKNLPSRWCRLRVMVTSEERIDLIGVEAGGLTTLRSS